MHNTKDDRVKIRRKDREIKDESWIKDILRYEPYCTVASALNNQPFVRPSAFYYSESDHSIFIHGAHAGRNFDNLKQNPDVCLCVYVVGKMRGHRRAFEFFLEQAGVIVFGKASIVSDNNRKHEVMQLLFEKHTPHLEIHKDYEPANQSEIDQTTIYRIKIDAWSAKMKWTDDEPIFRFDYEQVRGDKRAKLPWNRDKFDKPLTREWQKSSEKNKGLRNDA